MTVVVQYRDGSSETFTSVTDFDPTGSDAVKVTGVDSAGSSATWWIPWGIIKKVGKLS